MKPEIFDAYPEAYYDMKNSSFDGNSVFQKTFSDKSTLLTLSKIVKRRRDGADSFFTKALWINNQEWYLFLQRQSSDGFFVLALPMALFERSIIETSIVKKLENDYYDILENLHSDFVIINKDGIIEKVMPNFEEIYGISAEEAMGASVADMESRKIFNPSVALRVMKTKESTSVIQYTGAGKYLFCVANPIFDENGELKHIVSYTKDVTQYEMLKKEFDELKNTLKSYSGELKRLREERNMLADLSYKSQSMEKIANTIKKIASFDVTVMFLGESGVGKSMFAKIVHELSNRRGNPFISINCGAIPENLLESELFGYVKGAFTGANRDGKAGLVEMADGGTLFLDEIADLPLHMQVKILKAIQEKKITRIGSTETKDIDFRLVVATNKDIESLVKQGLFREDLYYRLNVFPISIPPIRERKDDIFPLLNRFLKHFCKQYGIEHALSKKAIDILETYPWHGNVREMENIVERMVLVAENFLIDEDDIPNQIVMQSMPVVSCPTENRKLRDILEEVEERIILKCYDRYRTTTKVAEILGISQPSASIKINKYLNQRNSGDDTN
jgi:PAS domain S-box-containing protein